MKWFLLLLLAALALGSGYFYLNSGREIEELDKKIQNLTIQEASSDDASEDSEETDETDIGKLKAKKESMVGDRTFKGILLTFVSAGFVGVLFVVFILPVIAHKFTHAIYDSGEMVEADPMHDAHSLLAQGAYPEAVEAFRTAAAKDPLNRLPWVEIAKIQRVHLKDPEAAIATLRSALEGQEWQVNDAAYLLFRLAELYDEDRQDRNTAAAIMMQVMEEFPETRHSANARHKMHEWGLM